MLNPLHPAFKRRSSDSKSLEHGANWLNPSCSNSIRHFNPIALASKRLSKVK